MRRFLAIVLMLFLPLQWSWSVAASLCEHEAEASHFGHHAHVHDGAEASASVDVVVDPVESPDPSDQGATQAGYHADCHTCHLSIGCIGALGTDRHPWPADAPTAVRADPLPEPPVEALYRPPLDRPALIG